ncbi:MAG: response regulator [Planctomycetota bacterium]
MAVGLSVLVVDDEPQIAEVCTHFLMRQGIRTESVGDGDAALERIQAEESIGVVFLELKLPGRDGVEILKEIKRIRPEMEVVIITAHGRVDNAVECMKLGARDFITKPFSKEKLLGWRRAA